MITSTNKTLLFVLFSATIATTLVNSDAFGSPTMAAYFGFVIMGSLFVLTAGTICITNKLPVTIANPIPLYFLSALAIYFVTQAWFNGLGLNLRHFYLLTCVFVLISLAFLFQSSQLNFKTICQVVGAAAGIESLICFLQFFKFIPSQNTFFTVTGSWVNPNVTAMFLVMALPAVSIMMLQLKSVNKRLALIVLPLIIASLVVLKCRTACIGAFIVAAVILHARFNLLTALKKKFTTFQLSVFLSISIIILVPIGIYSYHAKQASADGRKLIWKISLGLIAVKPVTGHGYGRFEHDYNLYQAKYFEAGNGTKREAANASYVRMAYNEFLENAVEGGVIGSVLFAGTLVALLIKPGLTTGQFSGAKKFSVSNKSGQSIYIGKEAEAAAAYAGIAAFAVMSVFNFTVQAIPVMCLFLIYAAVRITTPLDKNGASAYRGTSVVDTMQNLLLPSKIKYIFFAALIMTSICIAIAETVKAKAAVQSKDAQMLAMDGYKQEALDKFEGIEVQSSQSDFYLMSYGKTLFAAKRYPLALNIFNRAKALTSNPDLYMLLGNCYYKTGSYGEARNAYTIAGNIVPNKLAPRYALMKLYSKASDTIHAVASANQLIDMQPKVASDKADFYKKEAAEMVKALGQQ